MRLLAVVARAYEADAVLECGVRGTTQQGRVEVRTATFGAFSLDVVVSDVGPVSAGVVAAARMASEPYDAVISAGIAGAFPSRGLSIGDVVVATEAVLADLGVESSSGWQDGRSQGWPDRAHSFPPVVADMCAIGGAKCGEILTISRQSEMHERVADRMERHSHAIAEAMEGAGVGLAAMSFGIPFIEIRGVSNIVGVADRRKWNKPMALSSLAEIVPTLVLSFADHLAISAR